MNPITEKAIDLCRCGFSPSDATALAVMGQHITPAAIVRIEELVVADQIAREQRGAA